jgi:hypothetical protein
LVDILYFPPITAQVSQRMADLEYTGLVWCTQVRQRFSVVSVSHTKDSRVWIDCTLGNLAAYPGYAACNPVTPLLDDRDVLEYLQDVCEVLEAPHQQKHGRHRAFTTGLFDSRLVTALESWPLLQNPQDRWRQAEKAGRRVVHQPHGHCLGECAAEGAEQVAGFLHGPHLKHRLVHRRYELGHFWVEGGAHVAVDPTRRLRCSVKYVRNASLPLELELAAEH